MYSLRCNYCHPGEAIRYAPALHSFRKSNRCPTILLQTCGAARVLRCPLQCRTEERYGELSICNTSGFAHSFVMVGLRLSALRGECLRCFRAFCAFCEATLCVRTGSVWHFCVICVQMFDLSASHPYVFCIFPESEWLAHALQSIPDRQSTVHCPTVFSAVRAACNC
jgi:hypothetical protein